MEILYPQQLAEEGQAEYHKKEYLSAAKLYQAAAEGFFTSGDDLKAAEMSNNSSVAYLKAGIAQSALEVAVGTEKVFELKGDTIQQAMAIGNQAAALEKLRRKDEAMAAYVESARLLKEAGAFELRAYVMQAISILQLRERHYLEAYATMREGIVGMKKPNFKQRLLKSLIQIPYNFLK